MWSSGWQPPDWKPSSTPSPTGPMDGIEAAGHIQAQVPIPVVYISAYLDDQTLRRAQMTEPAGYLQKPVTEEALQQALARALGEPS